MSARRIIKNVDNFTFPENPFSEHKPIQVTSVVDNEMTLYIPMKKLRDNLRTGTSVISEPFTFNIGRPFDEWKWQLRMYPNGQKQRPHYDCFLIYLVLVDCPSPLKAVRLDVTVVASVPCFNLSIERTGTKTFDFRVLRDRWILLKLPVGQIQYRQRLEIRVSVDPIFYVVMKENKTKPNSLIKSTIMDLCKKFKRRNTGKNLLNCKLITWESHAFRFIHFEHV